MTDPREAAARETAVRALIEVKLVRGGYGPLLRKVVEHGVREDAGFLFDAYLAALGDGEAEPTIRDYDGLNGSLDVIVRAGHAMYAHGKRMTTEQARQFCSGLFGVANDLAAASEAEGASSTEQVASGSVPSPEGVRATPLQDTEAELRERIAAEVELVRDKIIDGEVWAGPQANAAIDAVLAAIRGEGR